MKLSVTGAHRGGGKDYFQLGLGRWGQEQPHGGHSIQAVCGGGEGMSSFGSSQCAQDYPSAPLGVSQA